MNIYSTELNNFFLTSAECLNELICHVKINKSLAL